MVWVLGFPDKIWHGLFESEIIVADLSMRTLDKLQFAKNLIKMLSKSNSNNVART